MAWSATRQPAERPPVSPSAPPQPPGSAVDRRPDRGASEAAYGDIVDEWGRQSFQASDPPANW